MALSIKTRQVLGVTAIVGLSVVLLSTWYVSTLAGVWLSETESNAEFLAEAIAHRAIDAIRAGGDPTALQTALQTDAGLQSILQASAYANTITYAAIVDPQGKIITHNDPTRVGGRLEPVDDLSVLLGQGPVARLRAIYGGGGQSLFEHRQTLFLAIGTAEPAEFGSIRIGVSTFLLRPALLAEMREPLITAAAAIAIAVIVAMLLAQVTLRPIHVLRSGLQRLGRGELNVDMDLPPVAELADLEDSFKAVSARLAADRTELAGQRATLESVVDNLEDAVALFAPDGRLLFANAAMRPSLAEAEGTLKDLFPANHPYLRAVESALAGNPSNEATTVQVAGGERLVLTHMVEDTEGAPIGVMLVARNLTYLTQVESMLSYSRKLTALGRLTAGMAHEVKNPLNATMIHLELLKMQLGDSPVALEHLAVIATQVRRLDEVVQGFLKFTRPEDLQLQPVAIAPLIEEILPIVQAEADAHGVEVRLEFPPDLPAANADHSLLLQAFLNLALNACQAMPNGGRLRIAGSAVAGNRLAVIFEDTGVGITPEHLAKIFDLYFTTKEHGSGIGLSLVYRTVQLLDGEIDVQSIPNHGTTFRIVLRAARVPEREVSSLSRPLGLQERTLQS